MLDQSDAAPGSFFPWRRGDRPGVLRAMVSGQHGVHVVAAGVGFVSLVLLWLTVGWVSLLVLRLATTTRAASLPKRVAERLAGRLRGRQVLVNVDPGKCVRFGFCEHEAPEVFQLRGDGRLTYRPAVPAAQIEQVIAASRVCLARAIV